MSTEKRTVAPPGYNSPMYYLMNPRHKFDLAATFKANNPSLCDSYEQNSWSYKYEQTRLWFKYHATTEWRRAYGVQNPFINLLFTGGILYGIGIYTAKEQGLIRGFKHFNFLKSHWFDWTTFLKRSAVGVAVSFAVSTLVFGDFWLAVLRIRKRYKSYTYVNTGGNMWSGAAIVNTNQ